MNQRILVPFLVGTRAEKILKNACWISGFRPALIQLVEIDIPGGFFRWLISKITGRSGRKARRQMRLVQRISALDDLIDCEAAEITAPRLSTGISEAAHRFRPDTIILSADVLECLGRDEYIGLKTRLCDIGGCVVVQVGRSLEVRIEPCLINTEPELDEAPLSVSESSLYQEATL